MVELDAEDAKLVTLARAALARTADRVASGSGGGVWSEESGGVSGGARAGARAGASGEVGASGEAGARAGAAGAVRDETGRTYVGVPVQAGPLELSALSLAVAMALASGAATLEAAVVVGAPPSPADIAALRACGPVTLHLVDPDGTLRETRPG